MMQTVAADERVDRRAARGPGARDRASRQRQSRPASPGGRRLPLDLKRATEGEPAPAPRAIRTRCQRPASPSLVRRGLLAPVKPGRRTRIRRHTSHERDRPQGGDSSHGDGAACEPRVMECVEHRAFDGARNAVAKAPSDRLYRAAAGHPPHPSRQRPPHRNGIPCSGTFLPVTVGFQCAVWSRSSSALWRRRRWLSPTP
jgi:hypothetical protein